MPVGNFELSGNNVTVYEDSSIIGYDVTINPTVSLNFRDSSIYATNLLTINSNNTSLYFLPSAGTIEAGSLSI